MLCRVALFPYSAVIMPTDEGAWQEMPGEVQRDVQRLREEDASALAVHGFDLDGVAAGNDGTAQLECVGELAGFDGEALG